MNTFIMFARSGLKPAALAAAFAGLIAFASPYVIMHDSTADTGVGHLAVKDARLNAVPEPTIWASMALAGAVLVVFRRRHGA